MLNITENKIKEKIKINNSISMKIKKEISVHLPNLGEEVVLEAIEELLGFKGAVVARVAFFGIKRIYSCFIKDKNKVSDNKNLNDEIEIETNKLFFDNENDFDLNIFLKKIYTEEEAVKIIELISEQSKILRENGINNKFIDILMIFIKFNINNISWFENLTKKDFENKVKKIQDLIEIFMKNNNINENELYGYLVDYDNNELIEKDRNNISKLLLDISNIEPIECNDLEIYNETFKGLYRKNINVEN